MISQGIEYEKTLTGPIKLTGEELDLAIQCGTIRHEEIVKAGLLGRGAGGQKPEDSLKSHILGAIGELVIHKINCREWAVTYNTFHGVLDSPWGDVKTRRSIHSDLSILPREIARGPLRRQVLVSMVYYPEVYAVRGWIVNQDMKKERFLKRNFRGPHDAYFVPVEFLNDAFIVANDEDICRNCFRIVPHSEICVDTCLRCVCREVKSSWRRLYTMRPPFTGKI